MSPEISRRASLRAAGVTLAAGFAGCSGLGSGTENESTGSGTATTNRSETPRPTLSRFYVGESDVGSDAVIDARAEVVAVRPDSETDRDPVVMVPGLGLSPYIYLATPDGRPGWVEHFVDAGYPVYAFNPPRNVDSGGLDTDALRNTESASLSRWSLSRAWPTWGFGPEVGEPYDDVRYPVEAVDQLVASFPAYVGTGGGGGGGRRSAATQTTAASGGQSQAGDAGGGGGTRFASSRETAALKALLDRVGPATLLVHSAGGASGFAVARSTPSLVERIVAVEPVGCPTDEAAVSQMAGDTPFMAVYGDYVADRGQTGRKSACETTAALSDEANADSRMLSLPDDGVSGNTHLLMQDDNNGAIADRILNWMAG